MSLFFIHSPAHGAGKTRLFRASAAGSEGTRVQDMASCKRVASQTQVSGPLFPQSAMSNPYIGEKSESSAPKLEEKE